MTHATVMRRRAASGTSSAQPRADRQETRIWWFSFLSFTGLVFETRFGTAAMALCLIAWVPLVAERPRRTMRCLRSQTLPWLVPLLALTSSLWSIEPGLTLRFGIELLLFTAVAIISASSQSLGSFVSSLACALFLGLVASAAFGERTVIGTTGEVALIGIFGSKNNFASFVCLMLLAGIATLGETRQDWRLRLVAVAGLLLSPVLLVEARSLGALFTAGGSVAAVVLVLALARMAPRRRVPAIIILLLLGGCAALLAILFMAAEDIDVSSIIVSMGKDPGLTGRTFLWSRARDYMAAAPLLGVGFQAFWVQGHVEAEGLWSFAQIEGRAGFHFHNTFYEAGVELGWVGIITLFGTLLVATKRVIGLALRRPDGGSAFLLGLFVFFAFRLTVEVDLMGSFSPGCLFLAAALVYGRSPGLPTRERPVLRARSARVSVVAPVAIAMEH